MEQYPDFEDLEDDWEMEFGENDEEEDECDEETKKIIDKLFR